MSYRRVISIAAAAVLGIACVSTEALAYRGVGRAGGVGHVGGVGGVGGVGRVGRVGGVGGVYRGGAVGVGAAVVAPRYYNSVRCGYYARLPC